jgi:hypothetical protein
MFPGSFMHKRASDLEGRLGLELRVHLTGPEIVWGLVRGHTPDDAPVEPPVIPLESSIAPHLQYLGRKQAVEVPIGGELVILATLDQEYRGAHVIS